MTWRASMSVSAPALPIGSRGENNVGRLVAAVSYSK